MNTNLADTLRIKNSKILQDPIATQIRLEGKPRTINSEPLNTFYQLFSETPQAVSIYSKKDIQPNDLIEFLIRKGWEKVYMSKYHKIEEPNPHPSDVLFAHESGYTISFQIMYHGKKRSELPISDMTPSDVLEALDRINDEKTKSYIQEIHLLYSPKIFKIEDEIIYKDLIDQLRKITVEEAVTNKIGIISVSHNDYYVKEFSIADRTPEFTFPDLHYGEGFLDFHNNLLNRLDQNNKGLVLFHGEPGTGKTQYIRILLNELSKLKKSVLYAPPGLSASLTDPEMIEFISEWIFEEERDCILLIEDAEPLLESRSNTDGRSTGISNLLNMTDGILNDILGLTVIATFNTQISNIDPALLRQQRLIARKEFKKLDKNQLQELAKALDMDLPNIDYPASLAEFYASKHENETLLHGVSVINKIGFKK